MSRGRAARPKRRPGGQARRPGRPLRQRVGRRLPSLARTLAALSLVALLIGALALVNGPWLRVATVAAAGTSLTDSGDLDAVLAPYRGSSLLLVDTEALAGELRSLPAVADASVTPLLPDRLEVKITEKTPAMTWLTRSARLVISGDGSILAALPLDADPPAELAALPWVEDQRSGSRGLGVGDALHANELAMARQLLDLDPGLIGSATSHFQLRIDDEYGFILVSHSPNWKAALGFYQLDPQETRATADARLQSQIAAIRTLFTTRAEAGVSWVDVRNPGKVYWAQ